MAPDEPDAPLKLRAEDADDLAVLSACLQDALVPVRDLAYVPDQQIFVFVANRFRWESRLRSFPGEARPSVSASYAPSPSARSRRLLSRLPPQRRRQNPGAAGDPPGGSRSAAGAVIHLEFSGDAAIRLEAARVLCHAKDLGRPLADPVASAPRCGGA